MIPTSIPDDLIEPGATRRVFAAPNGDLTDDTIRPVEALITIDPADGMPLMRMRLVLEPGELEALSAGEPVWLSLLGALVPFDVRVGS